MNTTLHTIDKLSLTIKVGHDVIDPLKVNMYNEVSWYLLPVIEEVFDSSIFSNYDMKIEKLTIDLGCIKTDNGSIRCCADKLKQMLGDELKKRLENCYESNCTVAPCKKNDEKTIRRYLISGIFLKRYVGDPDYLLEEILHNNISGFLQFLIDNKFKNTVIRRLVWQFKIDSIEKIIIALNPSDHEFIIEFVNAVKIQKNVYVNAKEKRVINTDSSEYHRKILEFTLRYCLLERQVQFNRVSFIHTILVEISNHYNMGIDGFLIAIIYSLQQSPLESAYKSNLLHLLSEIQKKYIQEDANKLRIHRIYKSKMWHDYFGKRNNSESQKKEKFVQYALQFFHLLDSGTSKEQCTELWNLMLKESIHDTIEFLYYYCTARRIIRNLVQLVDIDKVDWCIKMLAPDNLVFIYFIITTIDNFIKSATIKKQQVALEISRHKLYIYEFILEYLIRKKNGAFSEKELIHAILVGIANQHNIAYTSLIVTMLEFLINEACIYESSGYPKLITILQQLFIQNCKKNIPNRLAINKKVSRQLEIVELYESCIHFIFEGNDASIVQRYREDNSFENDLKTLYRNRPELIYSLFEMIKKSSDCICKIRNNCGASVCKTLLSLFVETIIDRYKHIHWLHSRNETLFKIQKHFEKTFLDKFTHDDILRSIISIDLSNVLNEKQFLLDVSACIKKQKTDNDNKFVECVKKNDRKYDEILTEDTSIQYFYFFIEHPGHVECNGIKKKYLLDYLLENHKEKMTKEVLKIVFKRPDLKSVVSQSGFLFDHRIKRLMSEFKLFAKLAKKYKSTLSGQINIVTIQDINTELFSYMCSEKHDNNLFNENCVEENIEITTKTLFSELHIGTVLSKEQRDDYGKIIQTLIRQSPDRLRMWLKSSSSNDRVVDNLSKIVTEKMFLQLLLLMGSRTAMVMYQYYTYMTKSIYDTFSGNDCEKQIMVLKKVMLELVFKIEVQLLNDDEIRIKTGHAYLDNTSDYNEKIIIKKITDQGTRKLNRTVNEHRIISSYKINETENSLKLNKKESGKQISNEENESLISEINIVDLEKEELLVANAGIVIGVAYFERLFAILKLTENKKFIDDNAVQKALKILHYFGTKKSESFEYELSFNKILCGVPLDFLVDPTAEITESDKEITDSLVDAIIVNWPVMKNTQRESFRESFLNRPGYISKCDNGWILKVEKRAFDMLINTLPWGFSMIKFPWMDTMVQVEWGREG